MFFMPFGPGGCAWLCVVFGACFVLVCLASGCCGWGLGGAMWSGFLGCLLTVALAWLHALLCGVGWGLVLLVLFGEFDPGSGRTLAACLTHASRTVKGLVLLVLDEWRTGE